MSKIHKRFSDAASVLMTIYVLCLFTVFPLYSTNKYFNILGDRTSFFKAATCATGIFFLILAGYYFWLYCKKQKNTYKKIFFPDGGSITGFLKKTLSPCDVFFIFFMLTIIISAFLSDNTVIAFTGEGGRNQGVIMWFCYFSAYFLVSRFYRPKREHLEIFVLMGAVFCLWSVLDYAGADPLGWTAVIKQEQRGLFTSTFGNINTATQAFALYYAVACVMAMTDNEGEKPWRYFAHLLSVTVISCGLIAGKSDNAVFAFALVIVLLPFILIRARKALAKYLNLLAFSSFSFIIIQTVTLFHPGEYAGSGSGVLITLSCSPVFGVLSAGDIICGICAGAAIAVNLYDGKKAGKDNTEFRFSIPIVWGCLCGAGVLALCAVLADANLFHPDRYEGFSNLLIFNDDWGTYRGMIWRLTIQEYASGGILQKLFGTGTETFGAVMKPLYSDIMAKISGTVYDSPHNEFLQYLFTTGIFGCVCYYGMVICAMVKGFLSKRPAATASAMAVAVYTAVSLVDISVPIVLPFAVIFMAVTQIRGTDT